MSQTEEPAEAAAFGIHREQLDEFAAQIDMLVDEAKIRFEPDGLRTRAVDPANVGLVETTIAAEAFDWYDGDETVIGANVDRLRYILGAVEADVRAEVSVHPDARKYDLELGDVEMTVAYIDPRSVRSEPDVNDLDLSTEVILTGETLQAIVAYADSVADRVVLGFDHDEWEFYATAEGDTDDMDFRPPVVELVDVSSSGDAHSSFDLGYLKDAVEAIPEKALVQLHIGEQYPLRLEYDFGPDEHGHTEFMMAPRLQSGGST